VVRGAGDKYRAAFEPLGDDLSATVDNLYIRLDKHSVHLATKVKQHAAILVCVLRRSTAGKQYDVHAFVCESPEQAVTIADHLHWLHAWYSHLLPFSDHYRPTGCANKKQDGLAVASIARDVGSSIAQTVLQR